MGHLSTSDRTTARSLWRTTYATGSRRSVPRPPTLSRARLGRTAIVRASMPGSATNYSTVRSSTCCGRPRSSSSNGGSSTTPNDHTARWDIDRRLGKPSCHHQFRQTTLPAGPFNQRPKSMPDSNSRAGPPKGPRSDELSRSEISHIFIPPPPSQSGG